MGFFSRKKQETAGVDYCLFCGMDLVNGVCSRCGREAKPMADFEDFEFKMVPASVADDLGEQKKKLFGNDLQQKACEISSNTLLLANKNEVLQQISDLTRRFSDEGSIPREYVKHVNAIIAGSLDNDDEWSRFKLHFDSVHPHFFVRLKELCPDLTENDLRLCAYISIGMRAKQIAEMLNVSPDSINSNRYRLRKKFGLLRGQSLDDYIRKV